MKLYVATYMDNGDDPRLFSTQEKAENWVKARRDEENWFIQTVVLDGEEDGPKA